MGTELDDLLAACERLDNDFRRHGVDMLSEGLNAKACGVVIADVKTVCSALPLLVARVRELDSLDHRIKFAFAEMTEAAFRCGPSPRGWLAMNLRYIDGERTESLLGEMQALTKEMSNAD